jgi:hypothetical protein
MATYIPSATNATQPTEDKTVESAALEFRTLKANVVPRLSTLETGLTAEIVNRTNADNLIVDMVAPYITEIANLGFTGNMDLGLVSESIIQSSFDLGTLT